MLREIIHIDEEKCDGCALCIPNCHEGALQIIDGKARLVNELMCDGLGACIGHCPQDAITIDKKDVPPYDELFVIQKMVSKGRNTVKAHLLHLKEHNEHQFLQQAVGYLVENESEIDFDVKALIHEVHHSEAKKEECHSGGCPGSKEQVFSVEGMMFDQESKQKTPSALRHWPVQLHLINPMGAHFQHSDLLIAADCTAFTMGNFHADYLKGKTLVIACPKLDQGLETYIQKIQQLIDNAHVNTIQVMIMEVPCCGGLLEIVKRAQSLAKRKVPVKLTVVSIKGEIKDENWI